MMFDRVSLHCPFCGRHTAVSPAPLCFLGERREGGVVPQGQMLVYDNGSAWWLGKCNGCSMPLLVCNAGTKVYPVPQPTPVSAEVPEPMRADLQEGKLCLATSAWNAAVVMARRALQSAAISQGAPQRVPLWQQIAWLDENRKITSQQREWADAARWVGNHGAHDTSPAGSSDPPFVTDVTEEDAKETIELVEHLFETLYVASTRARNQLSKRGKL